MFLPQNAIPSIYNATVEPHWIHNSSLFWYINTAKTGTQYVLVNLSARTKTVLSGRDELAALLSAAGGTTIDPAWLSVPDAVKSAEEQGLLVSPDMSKGVFLNNNNMYLRDLATGVDTPLTTDGITDYFYGRQADTTLEITSQIRSGNPIVPYAAWSPDSTRLLTFQVDQRDVLPLYLLQDAPQNNTLRPLMWTYRYSMPGENVSLYEPVIIDTRSPNVTRVQYTPWPETSMMDTGIFNLLSWSRDGSTAYALYVARGETTLRFLEIDPGSGAAREVITETGKSYRESNLDYGEMPEYLRVREEQGYHLVLGAGRLRPPLPL